MNRIIRRTELMKMYNRFLFIKADHLFENPLTILSWFAEYEEISERLASKIVQMCRLNSNREL